MSERDALEEIELEVDDFRSSYPLKKVPNGDVFEASRAGDINRLRYLLDCGVNVNARDRWDSVALYYACLAGHLDAARMLLESGAICSEHTFEGDRCHYAALNLKVRKLLKAFEARPPPLQPLQAALRDTFFACKANRAYLQEDRCYLYPTLPLLTGNLSLDDTRFSVFPSPDIVFYMQGRPLEAHRLILAARSPFFMKKFATEWKNRTEVRFSREKLSYRSFFSLLLFFYSDRLEVSVDSMKDLVRICRVCECHSLQSILDKEIVHQHYAEFKGLRDIDNSQKRFILQGLSLPEEDRLPAALSRILECSLSSKAQNLENTIEDSESLPSSLRMSFSPDYLADVCMIVDEKAFYCHQVILASRSEYFRARFSRMKDFHGGSNFSLDNTIPYLEEHGLSSESFLKVIEYMYTDAVSDVNTNLDQVEELFNAASRYLLFPLKRAVADVLLPYLETISPAELCHWLLLSDMYDVSKIREYCLDVIACNFETLAETWEFRALVCVVPPPSGESRVRTSMPSAPGGGVAKVREGGNLLDDLREKWLEAEGAELDKRDESVVQFDRRLEMLMVVAESEKNV